MTTVALFWTALLVFFGLRDPKDFDRAMTRFMSPSWSVSDQAAYDELAATQRRGDA